MKKSFIWYYRSFLLFLHVIRATKDLHKFSFLAESFLRPFCSMPLKDFEEIERYFWRKSGLEVGGLSPIFSKKGLLPVYPIANNVDNCNFSKLTPWEYQVKEGQTFNFYQDRFGRQFICEANDLRNIEKESYDFVICSHVIEHLANPLGALFEWIRVLKNNGLMLIVIPHKEGTFDHNRPFTSLEHLVRDYHNNTSETDLEHLEEIITLHDLSLDPNLKNREDLISRSKGNFGNRCLHNHVFTTESALMMVDYTGLRLQFVKAVLPWHIIICCQKVPHFDKSEKHTSCFNSSFFNKNSQWRMSSPFLSDKKMYKRTNNSEKD